MLVAATLPLVAGCTTTSVCADWVDFATPQEAYDEAVLVVVGTSGETLGTTNVLGVDVPVHPIQIDHVLKGDAPASLEVAQTPMTCGADPVPDPLDTDARIVLFLADIEGVWRPITPYDGVLDAPEGDPLPFETD